MEETHEQVVSLINNASLESNATAKVKLLEQVQELTVNKQPELLDNFFEEILQFQLDTSPAVRQHVIGFVEDACKKDSALLPKAIPTLDMLLSDESAGVKKRIILANTNIYQTVLLEVASARPKVRDPENLWNAAQEIKDQIRCLINDNNTGVRTAVLKFLELHILALSLRTSDSESKKNDAGLEVVPLRHPILDVAALRKDGRQSFELLIAQIEDTTATSINIQAMITLLCSIARFRPTFMERVITTMIKLSKTPPSHLSEGQVKSIQKKMKGALVTLLKHPASAEFHEQLIPVLEELEVPYTTINEFDMRGTARERVAADRSTKNDADHEPSAKRRRIDAQVEYERIRNGLPFPLLIDLLMASLNNLPDTLRRRNLDEEPAVTVKPSRRRLSSSENRLSSGKAVVSAGIAGGNYGSTVRERKHKKPIKLAPLQIKHEESSKLTLHAFRRVLALEGKMTEGGAKRNRVLLISRLASLLDEPSLIKELVGFVLESPKERKELALVWLYHQHQRIYACKAEEDRKRALERYEHCVEQLLSNLKVNLDSKDQLISWILLQLPSFTRGALETLKSYCEDAARNTVGFLSLRELIKERPPVREQCLPVLLGYTANSDVIVRTRAIRVCKKLAEVPALVKPIQQYAFDAIQKLAAVNVETSSDEWPAEMIKSHLYLYFDLLVVSPELLNKIIEAYPKMESVDVRRVVRITLREELFRKERKDPNARTIDWMNPNLLNMLVSHPVGSEDLILHLLHCITDSTPGKPASQLLAAVRKIHDKTPQDPRFLIPVVNGLSKTEVVAALPSLLSLKDNVVAQVIDRILGTRSANIGQSALSPSELLVVLHGRNIPTKDAIRALNKCFERTRVYTHEVLAVALQQLVDQNPLPLLFMRTTMLALNACPKLKSFVVGLLKRLLSKKIWTDQPLWKGFVKTCAKTTPQSLEILLQLPLVERQSAFDIEPSLRDRLIVHIKKLTPQQRAILDASIFEQLHVSQETGKPVKAKS